MVTYNKRIASVQFVIFYMYDFIFMNFFHKLAWLSCGLYILLFPGSTLTVALKIVPAWGIGFGAVLMLLQGAATFSWLLAIGGRRGGLAGLLCLGIAWLIEYIGEMSGLPFGRYAYTELLQPQIAGIVPLPITFAWLMVVTGAWQIAGQPGSARNNSPDRITASPLITATLVLLLDLQIETVATGVNSYWVWIDQGPYYGVPTANFVAWWVVGLLMAMLLTKINGSGKDWSQSHPSRKQASWRRGSWHSRRRWIFERIPSILYLLSTLMFIITNAAHGYWLAAAVGLATLIFVGVWVLRAV